MSVDASCHCGAVRLHINSAPAEVTDCNCSICRRYGVLWAYYTRGQVELTGAPTDIYMWGDKALELHRCKTCGCVTHWAKLDPAVDRMGVNARLMAPDVLSASRLRHLDGADTWQYVD